MTELQNKVYNELLKIKDDGFKGYETAEVYSEWANIKISANTLTALAKLGLLDKREPNKKYYGDKKSRYKIL